MKIKSAFAFLALYFCIAYVSSDVNDDVERHCFSSPFTQFKGPAGKRQIKDNWKIGGSTAVKENFIRLAPDRPRQSGWIYDNSPIAFKDFSILLKFRISGKGKSLYGDGMGFWVVESEHQQFKPGNLLGHPDSFFGFGVLLDTFRNREKGHVHKDISLVQSKGGKVDLSVNRHGCGGSFRYHEGRDSFSVENHSLLKLKFINNVLTVSIDRRGDGSWLNCFSANLAKPLKPENTEALKRGWMKRKKIHFVITASTGDMADNHDVLELVVTKEDNIDAVIEQRDEERNAPFFSILPNTSDSNEQMVSQLEVLTSELKKVKDQVNTLEHKMEYTIEKVSLEFRKMIEKLEEEEKNSYRRISELEKKSDEKVNFKLEERIRELEQRTANNVDSRLRSLERSMERKVEKSGSNMAWWMWVFFGLLVAIGLCVGWNYYNMRIITRRDKII